MRDEFLWVEKYRPRKIEECILPDNIKKTFLDFLDKGEVPNLLLAGPAGCGKTTVAKALCTELGVDYYVINGSDEGRFLDTVRNNAKNFPLQPFRLHQLQNTKSSSLMRQITQPTTFNSSYGRLLRSLVVTADSSSPATTKTKLLNLFTPDVPSSSLESKERTTRELQHLSSSVSKLSWMKRVLNMITKSW